MESEVSGAILLGAEILVLLVMLVGFVISRYGPESVRQRAASFYYHHIVHRG